MKRDMSLREFSEALKRNDMTDDRFMGYVFCKLPDGGGVSICKHNAGSNRRAQLAYLIREREESIERHARLAAKARATGGAV